MFEKLESRDLLSVAPAAPVSYTVELQNLDGTELARTPDGAYKLLPGAEIAAVVSVETTNADDAVYAAFTDLEQSAQFIDWDLESLTLSEQFPMEFGIPELIDGKLEEVGGYVDIILGEAGSGSLFTITGTVSRSFKTSERAVLTLDPADDVGHETLTINDGEVKADYEVENLIIAPEHQNPYNAGDADGNGIITPADTLAVMRAQIYAKKGNDPSEITPWWDTDGNNRLTKVDSLVASLAVRGTQDKLINPNKESINAIMAEWIANDWII